MTIIDGIDNTGIIHCETKLAETHCITVVKMAVESNALSPQSSVDENDTPPPCHDNPNKANDNNVTVPTDDTYSCCSTVKISNKVRADLISGVFAIYIAGTVNHELQRGLDLGGGSYSHSHFVSRRATTCSSHNLTSCLFVHCLTISLSLTTRQTWKTKQLRLVRSKEILDSMHTTNRQTLAMSRSHLLPLRT